MRKILLGITIFCFLSKHSKTQVKFIGLLLFLLLFSFSQSKAEIITNVTYNSKTYYVDILKITDGMNAKFEIWFRTSDNASSVDDIKMLELSANTTDIANYANAVCKTKELYDNGKVIAGCVSVIGSAFCAAATDVTAGTLAFVCTSVWDYTLDKGAANCFKGIADIVAKNLGKQNEWLALGLIANLKERDLDDAISKALDIMCEDIKNNAQ